jgi:hypothetical protein
MSSFLQLEEPVTVRDFPDDGPKLLVEWTSRWTEFWTSIKPALRRSEARLAGEAPFGLIPMRIMFPSYFLEAFLIFAAIFVQVKVAELRPYVAPRISSHDVIYYTGDELPRTEDLGGAEAAAAGRAGGEETHHHTQTIKIARGGSLTPRIVDAPNLKLPVSTAAVANLLAVKPDPGPPPAEGLRSSRSAAPNLAANIVAPAPNVTHDYTRNGVQLDSVIAPAPNVTRDRSLTAPTFNATMIPPAPSVPDDHKLVAPALAPSVIAPAPRVARDRSLTSRSLDPSVVAPAPNVAGDRSRFSPALASNVIPPAPGAVSREISRAPVQMTSASVVPPPVSAPERSTARNPKLSLPSPSVVAPPPSADISPDMRRLASGSVQDPAKSVVPPPPSQSGSGTFMSSLIGKIFGATEVVPPPPSVNSGSSNNGAGTSLASNVVPPPPSVNTSAASGNPRGSRSGAGASLGANVVAPPPAMGANGGTGTRGNGAAPYLGNPGVVPPPPTLGGPGGGTGTTGGGAGAPGGTLLANNVVPPPPSVGGGSSLAGSGAGRKGAGLGAPVDVGAGLNPATNGGSGTSAGAVISSQPGSKVGLPPAAGTGSLAMSPSGGDKPGLGGSGGGTDIGRGAGPGSSVTGNGTGAAKTGPGRGSEPSARAGISPTPGPGGAGNLTSGNPPVRGVDISGGSSIVTLPGFGSDSAGSAEPTAPGRTPTKQREALGVTVVATASSGGAFEPYKNLLRGEKYTTYLDTSLGTVVMEFADESTSAHPFGGTLTAPSPVRIDLPDGLPRARMVVTASLDASGNLTNIRVLEAGPTSMTAKVIASLRGWKFQPATRGSQPVGVTAILGFGIDTNDRF